MTLSFRDRTEPWDVWNDSTPDAGREPRTSNRPRRAGARTRSPAAAPLRAAMPPHTAVVARHVLAPSHEREAARDSLVTIPAQCSGQAVTRHATSAICVTIRQDFADWHRMCSPAPSSAVRETRRSTHTETDDAVSPRWRAIVVATVTPGRLAGSEHGLLGRRSPHRIDPSCSAEVGSWLSLGEVLWSVWCLCSCSSSP
jgi:hypothetical protein